MQTVSSIKNWEIGATPIVLNDIHKSHVNIAIYQRDTNALVDDVNNLLKQNIELKVSGKMDAILNEMAKTINPNTYHGITQDIIKLIKLFQQITQVDSFRLLLTTVSSNMCGKFHTDFNNLRMLCTYSGPGTLWLTEDNINKKALENPRNKKPIPFRASGVRQVQTGDVAILKGAIYPNTKSAVVHRSPAIEKTAEKRLLLRIDTNATQKLWT